MIRLLIFLSQNVQNIIETFFIHEDLFYHIPNSGHYVSWRRLTTVGVHKFNQNRIYIQILVFLILILKHLLAHNIFHSPK